MQWDELIVQLPESLRELGARFVSAYLDSDLDHADQMIDLAMQLDQIEPGRAFVERVCAAGMAA